MINIKEFDINPELSPELELREAETQIMFLFQNMCQFGAVDSEKNQIDNIIKDMRAKIITPQQAIEKATDLLNNKNGFLTQYR